ncbi:MAG: aminodeoxychorismate synthase component I [Gulosibacter sp.]|uniref:aminodeoxychorismate synthase component I n=1 Tax=Gulosibacter sp. TaxID=2817531 RepID=UPI003F901F3C
MIVIIDNRDSYTFNLAQLIAAVTGELPLVVSADDVFAQRIPERLGAGEFSHLVISPGPGTPAVHADFSGSQAALVAATEMPVLGVCLGHQGLGMLAGATVDRAPQARHGFVSQIAHSGEGIFRDIPQDFDAVRYHSLHVRDVDEATVRIHARAEDGVIMGLEVIDRPHWGVQFHPESILTEHGAQLIGNFLELQPRAEPQLLRESLDLDLDCEATFEQLQRGATAAFWLDSALRTKDSGRYSVLGTNLGSLARTIRYRVGGKTEVRTGDHSAEHDVDILTYLEQELAAHPVAESDIPYSSGFFGYLGYEMKSLTVPDARHIVTHRSEQPDAYWVLPQAHIVVDHQLSRVHLLVRTGDDAHDRKEAQYLLARLRDALRVAPARVESAQHRSTEPARAESERLRRDAGNWRLSDREYESRITDIKAALLRGDTYEVCLTDTFETEGSVDGLAVYQDLRRHSPAQYAAYFRFSTFGDDVEVLSASPELFLRVDRDRTVESKPIKGTAPRAIDPDADAALALELQMDSKTRAENLMIVDLLRNDLGKVCEIGSVTVPSLMQIESYAQVHQLVSSIRGTLREDHTLVDLLRATFPGGSMTGAPKARTLEIIDQLEAGPRGIYSGTVGYLGVDGQAELNIVIRTIVKSGTKLQIGAGGAIVLDSDANAEIVEKNLKAAALRGVISRALGATRGN